MAVLYHNIVVSLRIFAIVLARQKGPSTVHTQQTTLTHRQQAVNYFKEVLSYRALRDEEIQPYPLNDELVEQQGAVWGYGLSLHKPGSEQPEVIYWLFRQSSNNNDYSLICHT